GGVSIAQMLAEELKSHDIEIKRRSRYAVKGTFGDVTDSRSKLLAARINGQVIDDQGSVKLDFSRGVFGEVALTSLFGVTVSLDPKSNVPERNKAIEKALDDTSTNIRGGSQVFDVKGEYGIEILVKQGGSFVPRPAVNEEGLAFVEVKRGETYVVRLINNTDNEAGVILNIDGISMFSFSEITEYTHMVLDARPGPAEPMTGLVQGWHVNNTDSLEFVVGAVEQGAFKDVIPGNTANVGMITAIFCAAFPEDAPPEDEPFNPDARSRSASDATIKGPKVNAKYDEVRRNFGVVRATVTIRYAR
ncbi:MAG: hypothetical protein ACREJB_00975, partial [Planctomycetaceae bacterium]